MYKNETLTAPLQVDFNVTNRCNLSCPYCYASANERGKKESELTLGEIEELFDEFQKLGVLKVQIAGGEPLIREDAEEIFLLSKKFPFATLLNTNGTLLTESLAKSIKKSGIFVTVSLEGNNSKLHDKIRNSPNSFEKAIGGIEKLKKANVNFAVGTTLNSLNISHIFEMIDFTKHLGAVFFAIQVLCPVGRSNQNSRIIPSQKDFKEFFLRLTKLKSEGRLPFEVRVNVTNESPVFWEYYYPLFQEKEGEELMKIWNMDLNIRTGNQISCVAGRTVCSIEANGDVYPCEMFLGEEEMVVGNLRKDSFKKIWATSLLFKEFRKLTKDKINNPCKNCPNEWCGAGCRAAAFSSARSITGCDFHCYYANQN